MAKRGKAKSSKHHLIVSDEKIPKLAVKAGMRFEVVSVRLSDPALLPAKKIAARLCGGTDTCLALIEIEKGDPAPRARQ